MGKWISVLDYSVEQGSNTAKSNKPWQAIALDVQSYEVYFTMF